MGTLLLTVSAKFKKNISRWCTDSVLPAFLLPPYLCGEGIAVGVGLR